MKKRIKDIFKKPYILGLIVIFAVVVLIPEIWHAGKGQLVEGSIDKLEELIKDKNEKEDIKPTINKTEDSHIVDKSDHGLEKALEEVVRRDKEETKSVEEIKEDKKEEAEEKKEKNESIRVEIPSAISRNKTSPAKAPGKAGNKVTETKPVEKKPVVKKPLEKKAVIKTEEKTVTEEVSFKTIKKNDSSLEKGKEVVSQKGQKGIRTIVYKITYTDGKETSRLVVKDTVTKNPVDKILAIGTKENKPAATTNSMNLPNNYSYSYNAGLEDYMIKLINDYRASKGLNKLEKRADLGKSARYKSNSMLQLNYFSHSNPNLGNKNSSYLIRTAFGYSHYSGSGENLTAEATGERSKAAVERAFKRFQNSSTHDKNMLNPQWRYVGVGVLGSDKSGNKYGGLPAFIITQHFGK